MRETAAVTSRQVWPLLLGAVRMVFLQPACGRTRAELHVKGGVCFLETGTQEPGTEAGEVLGSAAYKEERKYNRRH